MEDVEDVVSFDARVAGRLRACQDIGYDLLTLTDWMVARWVRQGYLQPVGRHAMPNVEQNLLPSLRSVVYDPDRRYAVPWQCGHTVLAWNKRAVPGGLRGVEDLWDPGLHGRVEVPSELRETLGTIMFSQGVDPAGRWGDDELMDALGVVEEQMASGQVRQVKGNS
jgi:spermidine/putrescine transport system substrate-binding protein